ncbi:MAG: preprotein translocase subunit SecA [Alphaproteobacteria bacterium]|jgi:preprotein translocase subunit SecA|nr:preprotein translocase subunit SecA [Alphaproteobacteria bacterium]
MLEKAFRKLFGSANDRMVKKNFKTAEKINAIEEEVKKLSDKELRGQTDLFRERLKNGETLDELLVEAFATVREAAMRTLGQRPFDVQLVGGMVLHGGMITEMRTGEGKTLVATLPVYLNALSGKGVHVVTINDYLAHRDSKWMGQIYEFLGLTVGCIVHGLTDEQRRQAYGADVTYGTNHEFGFDYLRDNMKFRLSEMVQRPFNYAIVDEVDSILIDEARTPLIISGSAEDSSDLYMQIDKLLPSLIDTDFEKDEKQRTVTLTEAGVEHIEDLLRQNGLLQYGATLYDVHNIGLVHHVNQALRAHKLFTRDVDYIVKDDKVVIIDEFTGRMMEGRRYSEGLHQALEAKEKVTIEMENQTLASITYQNFFRMYPKLAGMTGTAMTDAPEFDEIYKLATVEIPTNVPIQRLDFDDEVYLTAKEKYNSVVKLIRECQDRKQPVLVGTTSIEKSEVMSTLLTKEKIAHQVLNARYHDQEAFIIAEAGYPSAVTIATNMAGRGTDIKLGGNLDMRIERELGEITDPEEREKRISQIRKEIEKAQKIAKDAGGLYVIGTERHESRRVDNQLRGRSGRQGDPGASKFFISLEDDLMRIFGSERLDSMLRKLGVQEGEAISHSMISKALARAQQKVEARNFDIRKHLLKYDDVMNDQRKIIYEQRRELMTEEDAKELIHEMRSDVVDDIVKIHIPENALAEQWDLKGLQTECLRIFNLNLPIESWASEEGIAESELYARIIKAVDDAAAQKEEKYGEALMRSAERTLLLQTLDRCWKENLLMLDHLRQGINLRAYAQSNPLNEYKREAFNLFKELLVRVREEATTILSHFSLQDPSEDALEDLLEEADFSRFKEETPNWLQENEELEVPGGTPIWNPTTMAPNTDYSAEPVRTRRSDQFDEEIDPKDPTTWGRVQRNALCPCGSGSKYKHCHGQFTDDE